MNLYYILFFFILIILIIYFTQTNLDIKQYATNLQLYNIIKKHKPNYPLVEPSFKYIYPNYSPKKNRYTIPIFDIKYNYKVINNILNDLIKYKFISKDNLIEINKLINHAKNANADLIFGVDENKFKIYADFGLSVKIRKYDMKCIIVDNFHITYKYYKLYNNSNLELQPVNKLLQYYNLSSLNNNMINHIYIAGNDLNSLDKWTEFHYILKKPIHNNIYVIGYKPNELTLYFR